jgi:RNA polymerase sigma factor (sigma-70 family)
VPPLTRYLRRLLGPPSGGGLTDAQLVERFVAERDEAAFEVLLWRHGPMVLAVCRRLLRHEQDAEDAFQATFLVLARKAASIGRRQAVGAWLHRVAGRVALRARALAAKRAAAPADAADLAAPETSEPLRADLRRALDEEVGRLPEKYRAPFVLCYLDGKTNEEAARELGCPKGTVLSRLAWARQRLRERLTRRGLALSAGLLGALAPSPAPAALVEAALHAALPAAGQTAVSGTVAALAQGALRAMLWTRITFAAGCVLAVAALGAGGLLLRPAPAAEPAPALQAKADDRPPDKAEPPPKEKTFTFEARQKPWKGILEWYSEISGLPFVGNELPAGTFTFVPPENKKKFTLVEITDILNEGLLAKGHLLVRRAASFTVLPADEKIDRALLRRVSVADLAKLGKTELVTVELPLKAVSAGDLAPEVKKLLGPFGDVVALEKANKLIVSDVAVNLLRVARIVKEVEDREAAKPPPAAK